MKSTIRVPRTSNDGNVFAIARSSTFQDIFDIYHASVNTEELALRNYCEMKLQPRKESCSATGADVDACAGCSASLATLKYADRKPSSLRPSTTMGRAANVSDVSRRNLGVDANLD